MRKPNIDGGFIVCFLLNLFFNCEWGLLALLLWAISYWFGISWYPAAVLAALWVLSTLGITAFLSWSVGSDSSPRNKDLPNVNPYSHGQTIHGKDYHKNFNPEA